MMPTAYAALGVFALALDLPRRSRCKWPETIGAVLAASCRCCRGSRRASPTSIEREAARDDPRLRGHARRARTSPCSSRGASSTGSCNGLGVYVLARGFGLDLGARRRVRDDGPRRGRHHAAELARPRRPVPVVHAARPLALPARRGRRRAARSTRRRSRSRTSTTASRSLWYVAMRRARPRDAATSRSTTCGRTAPRKTGDAAADVATIARHAPHPARPRCSLTGGVAEARSEKTLAYQRDPAWPAAVRFLRVDAQAQDHREGRRRRLRDLRVRRGQEDVPRLARADRGRQGRPQARALRDADRGSPDVGRDRAADQARAQAARRARLAAPAPTPTPPKKDEPPPRTTSPTAATTAEGRRSAA